MKAGFYFGFLLLIPTILNAQQPDIPVNPNFTWNGESSLAVNPANSNNLVVAWMKLTSMMQVTIAISHSNDKGSTWSAPVYMPHFSPNYTSADPALIFASDGTAFFAYIDYNKVTMDSGGVYVCKSTDGGASWTMPVIAIDRSVAADWPIDRPWLAISSNPATGCRLYLITKGVKEAPFPHHIYMVASTDNGVTWSSSSPVQIDKEIPVGPQSSSMGVPVVSQSNDLYIAYLSYDPFLAIQGRNILVKSVDGGNSFTCYVIDSLPFSSIIPLSDSLLQYSYYLASNPSDSENLIYIYTDRRLGDWDILYTTSLNGGITWSGTQRLNDDPVGNGIEQDMCWGGFSSDGKFAALWRDRRNGTSGQLSDYRIFGSYSADGGRSFHSNFALSQISAPLFIPIDGNDFLGVALSDSIVNGTWADKREFSNQVYFNRYSLANPSSTETQPGTSRGMFFPSVIHTDCINIDPKMIRQRYPCKISFFNSLGIKVEEVVDHDYVCFKNLPNGIYFCILSDGEQVLTQRFILAR